MYLEVKREKEVIMVTKKILPEQLALAMAVDTSLAALISSAYLMHVTINPIKVTKA